MVETNHLKHIAVFDEARRKIADRLARSSGVRIHAADDMKQLNQVGSFTIRRSELGTAEFVFERHNSMADFRTSSG